MSNAAISLAIDKISKAQDPKKALVEQIGELAIRGYKLMEDDVLLATYIRPEKTKGGIILTAKTKDEDRFQGKVGLLLKKGPTAFKYDRTGHHYYEGDAPEIHDWVVYRASEGWEIALNGVSCRVIKSSALRGAVTDPETIW